LDGLIFEFLRKKSKTDAPISATLVSGALCGN
jgi:hypothetical protein